MKVLDFGRPSPSACRRDLSEVSFSYIIFVYVLILEPMSGDSLVHFVSNYLTFLLR